MSLREESIARLSRQEVLHDPPAEVGPIRLDHTQTQQQSEEIPVIPSSNAIIHPRTMVITHRHTDSTEGTVFRSCRLLQLTCRAEVLRVEEGVVERVIAEPGLMGPGCDVVAPGGDAEVGEEKRLD